MVKRKTKRIVKRRVKSSSDAKKDFEIYAKGVQRLKELDRELNSLDVKGFDAESREIKSRLKNVSDIPFIETKIKSLKLKIRGKYHPRKKSNLVRKNLKEIKEDIQNVPKIEKQVRQLNEKIDRLNKPKVIDPEVGLLVDADFNGFLKDVKFSLSERLKAKENSLDSVLKDDLELHEKMFKEKHFRLIQDFKNKKKVLEDKFKQKYSDKVSASLQKAVASKFNKMLLSEKKKIKEKLDLEKNKINRFYLGSLKKHSEELIVRKKRRLEKKYKRVIRKKSKELRRQMLDEHDRLVKINSLKRKKLMKSISRTKTLREMFFLKKKSLNQRSKEIDDRRKVLDISIKDFENSKKKSLDRLRMLKDIEMKNLKEKFSQSFNKKLHIELEKKEEIMRMNIKKQYQLNLQKKLQEQETLLKEKRYEMEMEIKNKMRQLLG